MAVEAQKFEKNRNAMIGIYFPHVYRNNLKNRVFGKEVPQYFQALAMLKQALPRHKALSQHENFEKTDAAKHPIF